jgi:hypothetical protein
MTFAAYMTHIFQVVDLVFFGGVTKVKAIGQGLRANGKKTTIRA